MRELAAACERIAATTKKLEKVAIVAGYLQASKPEEASVAAVFLSGRPFPVWEETTLQVGGALLWRIVQELSGKGEQELTASYRRLGDLGAVAADVLPDGVGSEGSARVEADGAEQSGLTVSEVQNRFRQIGAARGPANKAVLVRELLSQVTALEAKYIIKIMTGDLRIGLKESLVEEAIAKAYGGTLAEVQRANMLLGDIGETLRFAVDGKLSEAGMRLFHPLGFMLATPAASAEEALSYFQNALVEDKYDGIRAQAHCSGNEVRVFSRTRDDITESFPELPDALAGLPQDAILDGEIVAWSYLTAEAGESGRALPFSALQQRLGRKKVSEQLMRKVPVAYLVFDILYAGGELLIDRPLRERARTLDDLLAAERSVVHHGDTETRRRIRGHSGSQSKLVFEPEGAALAAQVIRAPVFRASSAQELDQLFEAAQARGNEGLMIKDPESVYTPGRRGRSW
jgi:DNA ligase 1